MGRGVDPVPISAVFKPLYTSPDRYFLLTGGRASLKSSTVHDFIARLTYEQGHGVLFTRYTMASAESSIIPEFRITLERLGITADFKITKNVITNLRTGSFIYFSGIKTSSGDQTAKLKSIAGITTWVIEEGEDFKDEKAFDAIDDSIRTAGQRNRVIWIQNPTTKEHFIYQRWIEPANRKVKVHGYYVTVSALPGVTHIHTTYHLAERMGYLAPGWLEKANRYRDEAERAVDPCRSWYYYNYIGGWLERAEGVIFENWTEGEFSTYFPSAYGLDYGNHPDPLALVQVAIDKRGKKLYAREHIYETNLSTEGILARLAEAVPNKRGLIVCDVNEPRTTLKISQSGYTIHPAAKGAGSIVADIRDLQDYQIVVDPDSANLKRELNNYVWNDKKASVPIDDWNHLIDGLRYAFRRLSPKKTAGVRRRN